MNNNRELSGENRHRWLLGGISQRNFDPDKIKERQKGAMLIGQGDFNPHKEETPVDAWRMLQRLLRRGWVYFHL